MLLEDPDLDTVDTDVLVLGDDREATDLVRDLAATIPGVRGVYGGRLRNAHQVEAFTANLISVNRRYRAHAGLRITDVDPVLAEGERRMELARTTAIVTGAASGLGAATAAALAGAGATVHGFDLGPASPRPATRRRGYATSTSTCVIRRRSGRRSTRPPPTATRPCGRW